MIRLFSSAMNRIEVRLSDSKEGNYIGNRHIWTGISAAGTSGPSINVNRLKDKPKVPAARTIQGPPRPVSPYLMKNTL